MTRADLLSWPGLTYVRVRPTWIRYSNFGGRPSENQPEIVEFDFSTSPTIGTIG
jgi:hypothetical protein